MNIEYSALVRNRSKEGRFLQMADLTIKRRAIMSLLLGGEDTESRVVATARQADVRHDNARAE